MPRRAADDGQARDALSAAARRERLRALRHIADHHRGILARDGMGSAVAELLRDRRHEAAGESAG